ncbi:hypothetical protein [Nitrobacter sp. TKz-YC02]|uniref:hypothetical protein n=1 Tax=Nitrobacter sp. TKz-YC02 TaxID=3398704 RepID=UPI003CE6C393
MAYALVLSARPAIYLLGSAIYKKVVYGAGPASHIVGVVLLAALIPVTYRPDLLTMGWLTTIIMLVVSLWEKHLHRKRRTSRIARWQCIEMETKKIEWCRCAEVRPESLSRIAMLSNPLGSPACQSIFFIVTHAINQRRSANGSCIE